MSFEIAFAIIVPCLLGTIGVLFFLWTGAKGTAAYNLCGWERAAQFHREAQDARFRLEAEYDKIQMLLNEEESQADAYLAKLRKYGLEDMP